MEPRPKRIFEAAVDPMSLLLPHQAYLKWLEGQQPHVPKVLEEMFKEMTPAERTAAVEHAKAVSARVNAHLKEVEAVAAKFK